MVRVLAFSDLSQAVKTVFAIYSREQTPGFYGIHLQYLCYHIKAISYYCNEKMHCYQLQSLTNLCIGFVKNKISLLSYRIIFTLLKCLRFLKILPFKQSCFSIFKCNNFALNSRLFIDNFVIELCIIFNLTLYLLFYMINAII